ncbi:MAG: hypothetical protein ACRDTU_09135 [Micromonosporaceae bacterium]
MRTGTLHVLFGFFVALFVVSQANIIAALGPAASDMLRLQTTLSPETFRSIVEGFNADELARYRTHFAWDSVHPLVYGALLQLWTAVVHRAKPFGAGTLRLLVGFAIVVPVLDYIENAFHVYLEVHRGAIGTGTVLLSGALANLKWLIGGVLLVVLLLSSVRALFVRPRRKPVVASGPPVVPPVITPKPMLDKAGDETVADDRSSKKKARSTSTAKS